MLHLPWHYKHSGGVYNTLLPERKWLFAETVPENKKLFAGTVPANKLLFSGTVPANNLFLIKMLVLGSPFDSFIWNRCIK